MQQRVLLNKCFHLKENCNSRKKEKLILKKN